MENYSYYGRMNVIKPRIPVIYNMIDDYIQRLIDKEINRFKKELIALSNTLKSETRSDVKSLNKRLKEIEDKFKEKPKNIKCVEKEDLKEMKEVKEKVNKILKKEDKNG